MRIRGVTLGALLATGCAAIPSLPTATDDTDASDGSIADAAPAEAAADASDDVTTDVGIDAPADAACVLARSTGDATCDACLTTSCCAVANACVTNTDCAATVQCVRDCIAGGTAAGPCRTNCRNAHPMSKKPFNDLLMCISGACKNASCG